MEITFTKDQFGVYIIGGNGQTNDFEGCKIILVITFARMKDTQTKCAIIVKVQTYVRQWKLLLYCSHVIVILLVIYFNIIII